MFTRTLLVGALALGLAACADSSDADVSTAGADMTEVTTFADAPGLEAGTYTIDATHSGAEFRVRHLGISTVTGHFDTVSGTLEVGDGLGSLQANAVIDASTIDTGNDDRDGHLQSADFFDVAQYPEITFQTTEIRPSADGFILVGDLTMHGVMKSIELESEYLGAATMGETSKIGFTASGEINRKDWGLSWAQTNEAGEALVGDMVELVIEVEANRDVAETVEVDA